MILGEGEITDILVKDGIVYATGFDEIGMQSIGLMVKKPFFKVMIHTHILFLFILVMSMFQEVLQTAHVIGKMDQRLI